MAQFDRAARRMNKSYVIQESILVPPILPFPPPRGAHHHRESIAGEGVQVGVEGAIKSTYGPILHGSYEWRETGDAGG